MLVDHGPQIFTCTDGCPTSAGSIFRLVLRSGGEDVTRLFFRRPGGSVLAVLCEGLPRHILVLLLVLGRSAGMTNVGVLATHQKSSCPAAV